jgi:hypothetical protein
VEQVEIHLGCFHCGYDLRGLPRKGQCPECGKRIALSEHFAAIPRMPLWLSGLRLLHVWCVGLFLMLQFVTVVPRFAAAWDRDCAIFGSAVALGGLWLARRCRPYHADRAVWIAIAAQVGLLLVQMHPWDRLL